MSPTERGLHNAENNPELLDDLARNLYLSQNGPHFTLDEDEQWEGLLEFQREAYRQQTLNRLREFAGLPTELQQATQAVEYAEHIKIQDRIFGHPDDEGEGEHG